MKAVYRTQPGFCVQSFFSTLWWWEVASHVLLDKVSFREREKCPAADYCQLFQMIDNMKRSLSSLLNAVTLPSQPINSAPVCCPHQPSNFVFHFKLLFLRASWVSTKGLYYPTLGNGTATVLSIPSSAHSWEFWHWRGSKFAQWHVIAFINKHRDNIPAAKHVSAWQALITHRCHPVHNADFKKPRLFFSKSSRTFCDGV